MQCIMNCLLCSIESHAFMCPYFRICLNGKKKKKEKEFSEVSERWAKTPSIDYK